MRDFRDQRSTTWNQATNATDGGLAPGKRTLVEMAPQPAIGPDAAHAHARPDAAASAPVQRKAESSDPVPATPSGPRPTIHDLFGRVQRKAVVAEAEAPRPGTTLTSPAIAAGPGTPLAADVRAPMERAFAADFAAVRVHEGAYVRNIGARAFASGASVHFAPGEYDPGTRGGRELLGHELAHVVQQSEHRAPAMQHKGLVNDDPALEAEADQLGARAADGEIVRSGHVVVPVPMNTGAAIQGVFVAGPSSTLVDEDTGDGYAVIFHGAQGRILVERPRDHYRTWIQPTGTPGQWAPIDDDDNARDVRCNHASNAMMIARSDDEPASPSPASFASGAPRPAPEPTTRIQGTTTAKAPSIAMVTNFTVQVNAAPIAQGEPTKSDELIDVLYTAQQVWVESIRIGNQDRPDTRFGARQERHTVAWTLERAAQIAQSGQTAFAVLQFYLGEFDRLASTEQPEPAVLLIQQVRVAAAALLAGRLPIDRWQAQLSYIATIYTQAYQASSAATFKSGRAIGHGEGFAMECLRTANQRVIDRESIDDLGSVAAAASTLLDVQFNLSLGEAGYASAVRHWIQQLMQAFGPLMEKYGGRIVEPVLQHAVSAGVARRHGVSNVEQLLAAFGPTSPVVSGIMHGERPTISHGSADLVIEVPPELAADFVANIEVTPAQTGRIAKTEARVGATDPVVFEEPYYAGAQLEVRRVHVSDRDRPDTKFDTQMSHTVAWTLVRADLEAFAGKSIDAMLHMLGQRLLRYAGDLKDSNALRLATMTAGQIAALRQTTMPIYRWQAVVSDIVRRYTIVYQKAGAASFADDTTLGRALGHGEGSHMRRLRDNEKALVEHGKLCDDPKLVIASALALLDARINSTLSAEQFVSAVLHWNELITRVFPEIAKGARPALDSTLASLPLPPEVAKTYAVTSVRELIGKLKGRVEASGNLFDLLKGVHPSKRAVASPQELVGQLGFMHHPMSGNGNDCAIASIYDQLTRVHGLAVGDSRAFSTHVRTHAHLEFGTMIDVLNNGAALLGAVQGWLDTHVLAARGGGLVLDVWSQTAENSLMEFQRVAAHAGAGDRILRLYFNGVNHFDSLSGGPPR